jgi:TatD DNase family protein
MILFDSHTHLYLEEFDDDRKEAVQRAIHAGVVYMAMPNIDHTSWEPMMKVSSEFPGHCYPMAGLHPTSVHKGTLEQEILLVEEWLEKEKFIAIGEIGIDLYWDKTYLAEQQTAFRHQVKLAKRKGLPIVIHTRDSFDEVYAIVKQEADKGLTGVFHCFQGSPFQAKKVTDLGFYLGIGGSVTYKNSRLPQVISMVGCENILLETDAPFLAPIPYRGKRNESAYVTQVAEKVAELLEIDAEEVAGITTRNAKSLFNI